jgi:hypothetical protein
MNQEYLNTITETATGYPVKNLRWLKVDNIITGLVKDPVCGKETLHDGYISGQWTRKGIPTNKIKGREDLRLNIDLTQINLVG